MSSPARPGVATTIDGANANCLSCFCSLSHPQCNTLIFWHQRSEVKHSRSAARSVGQLSRRRQHQRPHSITIGEGRGAGRANANVFPEPVWAAQTTSLPRRILGMQAAWQGVGFESHSRERRQESSSEKVAPAPRRSITSIWSARRRASRPLLLVASVPVFFDHRLFHALAAPQRRSCSPAAPRATGRPHHQHPSRTRPARRPAPTPRPTPASPSRARAVPRCPSSSRRRFAALGLARHVLPAALLSRLALAWPRPWRRGGGSRA